MDIFKVCKGDDLYTEFISCKCDSSLHNHPIECFYTPVEWLKEYEMCSEAWEREEYYAILTCDKYIDYMEYMYETDFTIKNKG